MTRTSPSCLMVGFLGKRGGFPSGILRNEPFLWYQDEQRWGWCLLLGLGCPLKIEVDGGNSLAVYVFRDGTVLPFVRVFNVDDL
jgi:hypothetical protein